jgi:hypothetical protein
MAEWPSNNPPEETPVEKQYTLAELTEKAGFWVGFKKQLESVKDQEMALRKELSRILFPTPKKGTQRYDFGSGYFIKLQYKLNHKLCVEKKIDETSGAEISKSDQVIDVQNKIEALGQRGKFLSERLFKWTPELVVKEYESLDISDPIEKQIKLLIEEILTIEEASPTLEAEEPKL